MSRILSLNGLENGSLCAPCQPYYRIKQHGCSDYSNPENRVQRYGFTDRQNRYQTVKTPSDT